MSRGKRPDRAIGDAVEKALAGGFVVYAVAAPVDLAFDFVAEREGTASRVRVRRLKYAGYQIENILQVCRQQIRELRESMHLRALAMELWVRGPGRAYHRYRVLPDTVEELGNPAVPVVTEPAKAEEIIETPEPEKKNPDTGGVRWVPYVQVSPLRIERIKKIMKRIWEEKQQRMAAPAEDAGSTGTAKT